jgi:hypothetical protein
VVIAIDVKDLVALHTEHTVVKNNEKIVASTKYPSSKDLPRQNTLGQASAEHHNIILWGNLVHNEYGRY